MNTRWFQLAASLLAMIMIANLQYAWTLFVEPMRAANGWELRPVQDAFTLFILFQTWVQPLDGWLIDRLGPRLFISLAGILCGAGWAGMGQATSLTGLRTMYVIAGIGAALTYSGSIGSALKWFKEKRGMAAGIMAAGYGAGTALFIPWISSVIATRGYRTAFLWTGILQGVTIFVVAQFLRHPKAPPPVSTSSPAAVPVQAAGRQISTPEMLRMPRFYVLYVALVCMATGGLLVTAHAGPLARAWGYGAVTLTLMGWSANVLVMAATLSPIANGASRIFWGVISDRFGREPTMVTAFLLQAVCLLMVTTMGQWSGAWFTLALVLTYFTWGEAFSLFPSICGDYFGSKHATSNYSVLYTAKGVAAVFGVSMAAALHDSTGTWTAGFFVSSGLAAISAVLIGALKIRQHSALKIRQKSTGGQGR